MKPIAPLLSWLLSWLLSRRTIGGWKEFLHLQHIAHRHYAMKAGS